MGFPLEAEERVGGRATVTLALVAANALVYLVTAGGNALMYTSSYWVRLGGFLPIVVLAEPSQAYRILTSMFMHGDILHIFFNMYFLYTFGRAVENTLGSGRYLVFYIASGVGAAVFHTVFSYLASVENLVVPAVGASGAISGVLGAYMLLYPGTRLTACFWFPLPLCFTMNAVYFLLFWFSMQVFYGYAYSGAATVAFFAHAGGFVTGIALLPLLAAKERILLLRRVSSIGRLFDIIVFQPYYQREGIGGTAKLLFSALTVSIAVGTALAFFSAANNPLVVDVSRISASAGATVSEGYLIYTAVDSDIRPLGLMLVPDEVRILINRLWYAGLLYDPERAGRVLELSNVRLTAKIDVCGHVYPVEVYIHTLRGRYNDAGLLVEANGRIESPVLRVDYSVVGCRVYRTSPIEIVFGIRTVEDANIGVGIAALAVVSLATSLGSLYTVLYRDTDYVIVPSS